MGTEMDYLHKNGASEVARVVQTPASVCSRRYVASGGVKGNCVREV